MTKLPRLYVNGKFNKIVHPISTQITQNIVPLSTASMTLLRGEELPSRSYLELFTPYGSAGFFRVRSPHDAYGDSYSTAELEHMAAELGDYLVKDEISKMMSAKDAVKTVFGHYKGKNWKLGKYDSIGTGSIALDVKYDSVLNVLLSILEQKPDFMMSFDFTTSPWSVNIVKKGTTVAGEGRLSRNVQSAIVTYDDSELVTRVWYQVFSKNAEGAVQSSWTSKDADTLKTYGVVEGTVSTSADMTSAEVNSVVNTFLAEHKHPRTSVSIQAQELNRITGERMDKFLLGDLFRLNLRDYNLTVELPITSITWSDVYNSPESVSVHLGKDEDTVVTFLHNLDATGSGTTGGSGGGGSYRHSSVQNNEYRTKIDQTDQTLDLYAQRVDKNKKILELAGMSINSKGVLIYATDDPNNLMSKIDVKLDSITISSKKVKIEGTQGISLNDVITVTSGRLYSKGAMRVNGDIMTQSVTLRDSSGDSITINEASMTTAIKKARVSGNTLILTPFRGNDITFSKAISSWEWGGGNGKVKVTAKPQNQSLSVDLRVSGDVTITQNGTYSFKAQYEDANGSYWDTGAEKEITVNVPGSSYPYSKTMTCTSKNYSAGTWVYTLRYSVNNSSLWNVDQSYTFHHNSGYT